MGIKFKAKPEPWSCVIKDDPPHTKERARWSDGWWSDICTRHMEIFRRNLKKHQSQKNPLWFLGRKPKENK